MHNDGRLVPRVGGMKAGQNVWFCVDTRAAESRDTMLAAHATPANGACDSRTTAGSDRANVRLQRPLLELVRCTSRSVSPDTETQCPSRKRRGVLVKLRGPPVAKLHRRAQRRPGGRPGGAPVPYRALCDRAVTRRRRCAEVAELTQIEPSTRAAAAVRPGARLGGAYALCCHRNAFAYPWLSEERQQ